MEKYKEKKARNRQANATKNAFERSKTTLRCFSCKNAKVRKIGLKQRTAMSETECRTADEFYEMVDKEFNSLHFGDIRIDTDGVICAGTYVKLNQ